MNAAANGPSGTCTTSILISAQRCSRSRSGESGEKGAPVIQIADGGESMKRKLKLSTFQIGAPARRGEGLRIGVTRRPPRGVPKSRWVRDGYFDVWLFASFSGQRRLAVENYLSNGLRPMTSNNRKIINNWELIERDTFEPPSPTRLTAFRINKEPYAP